jgi:dolichol-phosphate mannosyltransferase
MQAMLPPRQNPSVASQTLAGDRLSLVIPAWNEEACIDQALREATEALAQITAEYEIIVVDDGSEDQTTEIVAAWAERDAHVRLVRHGKNEGYAAALRSGFAAARLELVAFTDADCQFELGDLEYMLPLARRYDIVCGSRLNRQDPTARRFYSWGYNTLVRLLMGSPVHDLDCALKIFHRDRLTAIWPQADGYFINTEMLSRARLVGQSIVEVGVRHRPRQGGKSKVALQAIPQTLARLLPFWWTQCLFAGGNPPQSAGRSTFWLGALALALVAGLQLFAHLDYRLFEPDEGRYAEIGREILAHREWIVPKLHGNPYLDKPPLFYWALATSFRIFGTTDWAARCVPALAAWLTILSTYIFGCRLVGVRAAWIAGLAMTSAVGVVYVGRFLVLDGLLSLWIALAMFSGLEAIRGTRLKWSWWCVSALFCALGCLTKGPVALALVALPLAAYPWLNQSRKLLRGGYAVAYVSLVAAAIAPWFVAMLVLCPQFAYYFFVEHHLVRFVGGLNHPQPFWFYLPVLLLGGLPGTLLAGPWLEYQFSRDPQTRALRSPVHGFFLLWAAWCLAFFTIASCKLPSYILPAAPALALLLGVFADQFFFTHRGNWGIVPYWRHLPIHASMVCCAALLAIIGIARATALETAAEWAIDSLLCAAVLGALIVWGRRLRPWMAWSVCCLLVYCFGYESSHDLAPAWAASRSPLPESTVARSLLKDPTSEIVVVGQDWGSIPFYLGRDNIHNFDEPASTLKELVGDAPRTLFIARQGISSEVLAMKVPEDMQLVRLVDAGRATIWLAQRQRQAGRPNGAALIHR